MHLFQWTNDLGSVYLRSSSSSTLKENTQRRSNEPKMSLLFLLVPRIHTRRLTGKGYSVVPTFEESFNVMMCKLIDFLTKKKKHIQSPFLLTTSKHSSAN